MLKELLDTLDARIEDATNGLDITCIKGYPAWDRPNISLPIAAIWLTGYEVDQERPRVGQLVNRYLVEIELAIFAGHELELVSLLDSATSMFDGWQPTVSGQRIVMLPARWERLAPDEAAVEQTRYAMSTTVALTISI